VRGEPLTVYGDGSLIRLMNGAHTGPINLGNPGEFPIRQLAELVRARINPELPLIDLAQQHLGWQPTIAPGSWPGCRQASQILR
jgi:UDP-glucuronate decarboxylase